MNKNDKKKIFDYIFSNNDIPEDLKRDFYDFFLVNGEDREIEEAIESELSKQNTDKLTNDDIRGLLRLSEAVKRRKPSNIFKKIAIAVCSSAAAFLLFAGGLEYSRSKVPVRKETTLLAAEQNVSKFKLPDGSEIWLSEGSSLSYSDQMKGRKRKVTLNGEAYFKVKKDASHPFIVGFADNTELEVLGTVFDAVSNKERHLSEVILKEGSVRISNPSFSGPVLMRPNDKFTFSSNIIQISQVDASTYRWYEKVLVFDRAGVGEIFDNLSRRYNMEIIMNAKFPSTKLLSLTIDGDSIEDVMNVMGKLLPISWTLHGNTLVINNK